MILVDNSSEIPLYMQIYKQIKESILTEQLSEGNRLPSIRELSKTLNVSKNTVDAAYLQLRAEGYINSKKGSGFTVEKIITPLLNNAHRKQTINSEKNNIESDYIKYDFQYGKLSPEEFPFRIWRKLINRSLQTVTSNMTSYGDNKGEISLRIEIMNYLNGYRGVKCNVDQIIICPGTQACLSLLCQLFKKDTRNIAMEDPGYNGARNVFENHDYTVIPVELTTEGIDINALQRIQTKLLYITPSHQFPTGSIIPISKRLQILEWAIKNNAYIIEDDYDSELRYSGRPIPSMQCIDHNERVIYTGTFSKALAPALRISYLVLPMHFLPQYDKYFHDYDCSVPWLEQNTLAQFMQQGHWENHLRKVCHSYKKKYELLVKTINQCMGDKVIIHGKNAGLHLLLEVLGETNESELVRKAGINGVRVYPVSPYWIKEEQYSNNFIMLGFSSLTEEDIVAGIALLYKSWFA